MTIIRPTSERHCDRCGAFIAEKRMEFGAIIEGYWMPNRWDRAELCGDCAEKLREWLDDPATYIAHIPLT